MDSIINNRTNRTHRSRDMHLFVPVLFSELSSNSGIRMPQTNGPIEINVK